MGFLPYDLFPRHGRWPDLAPTALVYHMTLGCVQEKPTLALALALALVLALALALTLTLTLALTLTLTLGPRAGEGALLLTWRAPLPWQPAAPRPVRPD